MLHSRSAFSFKAAHQERIVTTKVPGGLFGTIVRNGIKSISRFGKFSQFSFLQESHTHLPQKCKRAGEWCVCVHVCVPCDVCPGGTPL